MRARLLAGIVASLLVFGACGSGQKVGSEKLLEFEEQENAEALGRAPDATEKPLTIEGTPTPTPVKTATPTQAPRATPAVFDVELVTNSPYYKPGNCLVIPRPGMAIRVTNKDNIPERKAGRSFTDQAGSFHSGMLKPGQTWTWVFDKVATYEVVDDGLKFANATLHVGRGSCP